LTEPTPAVAVEDLEVVYQRGGEPAVTGLAFALPPGGGLLLIGGEGAGKTTVLRAVLGLVPFTGTVVVLGGHPGDTAVARRVGYAPQGRAFTEGHTAREIVRLVAALRTGRHVADDVEDALDRAGLPSARRAARALDLEESRRVALACAVAGDPDLLVLDDPWEHPETVDAIRAARARGAAVLAATHLAGGFPDLLGATLELPAGAAP
jgi:ABC-type multidrug transport system ATPase subunit